MWQIEERREENTIWTRTNAEGRPEWAVTTNANGTPVEPTGAITYPSRAAAQAEAEAGDYVASLEDENIAGRPVLLVCPNREMARFTLDLEGIDEALADDAADWAIAELMADLEDRGYVVEPARGKLATFHGWNGARMFRFKAGPIGSFDPVEGPDQDMIRAVIADLNDRIQDAKDRAQWHS